jgi:hypothetical protein
LIKNGQQLSFDKRKGEKARRSRSKKTLAYADLKQLNLFDLENEKICAYPEFKREYNISGILSIWSFVGGKLDIILGDEPISDTPKTDITLTFFGTVTSNIRQIRASAHCALNNGEELRILWSEIHRAISEITSYDSLIPLYGHFTEPYPKFEIHFRTSSTAQASVFQKLALDGGMLSKIQPYSLLGDIDNNVDVFLKSMREFGYDVRTNHTNRTIPAQHFRICYPFTMPADAKNNIVWAGGMAQGVLYGRRLL